VGLGIAGAAAIILLLGLLGGVCYAQTGGGGSTSNEPAFIKNLHITGFVQNTTSTWLNSNAIEYNKDHFGNQNKNSLAAERNLIQVDVNDDFTENDSMFLRAWGVYEPSYPWEIHCSTNSRSTPGKSVVGTTSDCTSDFYNYYGIREMWFKHRAGPLQLFVGKQIVTWGESLAFRVGDQINPTDTSYAFGFSNLETSRAPLWMLHPILNLPSAGPFSSNFAELVYIPGFDFMYTQVDDPSDQWEGLNNIRGRVNVNAENPGGRFAGRGDNRVNFGLPGLPDPCLRFNPKPFPSFILPAAAAPPFALCQVNGPGSPGAASFYSPQSIQQVVPNATWGNSQIGFRLHTLVSNTEVTMFYLWSHDYNPVGRINNRLLLTVLPPNVVPVVGNPGIFARRFDLFYPQYQAFGITANRPLYLPGALAQLPFVVRAESLYKNHDAFNTFAVPGTIFTNYQSNLRQFSQSAVTRSDTVLWLIALDLDQAYTPWLTTTGNLTANFEVNGTTILSYSNNMQGAASYFERAYHNDINLLVSVSTSWWWGAVSPNWTTIYNPDGETFLLFPSLQLTPPWTNKYFMKLEWVDALGTNKFGLDGGVFKGLGMIFAQFQYNFSLL
jgi:hypothetical protein